MRPYALTWCAVLALSAIGAPSRLVADVPQQAPAPRPVIQPSISKADALADIEALFRAIENVHPHPYNIVPRETVQAERQRVETALPDIMTRREFWFRTSPLVASLGDGHTRLHYPLDAVMDQFIAAIRASGDDKNEIARRYATFRLTVFPPNILGLDDQHLVVTSDAGSTGFRRGDRIISINGHNADGLLADWVGRTSGDSQSHRAIAVADGFHRLLLVHSIIPPYTVTVADADGRERTITVDGVPVEAPLSTSVPQSFSYRAIAPGVGYMDFYSMDSDRGTFKKALAGMFRQLAADSVGTLVIDLRRNSGGYEEYGSELLRYVTTKPYRNGAGSR